MCAAASSPEPALEYDPSLPITAHRAQIVGALAKHRVLIVCGATGSGKSTQLPKLCLEAGRGTAGLIGHTQPRRIAARALAARISAEIGASRPGVVGYQVRFEDRTSAATRIKLMTDGILLRELAGDRELRRYDTIIIDEAHERTLNIDLLLGVLKEIVERRPELRVIVTSATIDPDKFSRFFGGAPVIEVSGRSYPVETRYRPLAAEDEDAAELSLPQGIVAAIGELDADPRARAGDTLVFLPGENHIREAAAALEDAGLDSTEVLSLYARLSLREQEKVFEPHARRRIVLATNVAETSITVPGIRAVIDSGLARISRYSTRGKVQRLPIEPISQASADQRAGRCGREAPGICIRLYSGSDFESREAFTPPEVLRTNLASVILQMAALDLGEPGTFPFPDPPDTRLVNDGVRLLQELRAMDDARRVTPLGRELAALPADPRLGRMLLAAGKLGSLAETLIVAAFLEVQDPRERPADAARAADEKHAAFADRRSDFITAINLWRAFEDKAQTLGSSALRRWCRDNFLSFRRMREWRDVHSQLSDAARDLRLKPNRQPASYAALHRAILTGFLGFVGRLDDRREYVGPRGIRFSIAPGTPLASRRPPWIVAASLVETRRLYARMVAAVQPHWIESSATHLVRREYTSPQWIPARGHVGALESISLHNLTLVARRRVNYAAVDARHAHEIFLLEGLVEGRADIDAGFLRANDALRAKVERLEAKIRRRDILVDDAAQVEFYRARIPDRINSRLAFEQWLHEAEARDPKVLEMTPGNLMRREAPEAGPGLFPDEWSVGANRLPLEYRFDPESPDDGITLVVPEPLLGLIDDEETAWLVPGARLRKLEALFRALPKSLRRALVPVPDSARRALEELKLVASIADDGSTEILPPFHSWLAGWISHQVGVEVSAAELAAIPLEEHLRMNLRVIDEAGRVLESGRDAETLRRRLGGRHARSTQVPASAPDLHRSWDFGAIAESVEVDRDRLRMTLYPALEDRGQGAALVEVRTPEEAEALSRAGITRLALLALPQQAKLLRRDFAANHELVLLSQGLELTRPLPEMLTERVFRDCFAPEDAPVPRDPEAFAHAVDEHRADLAEAAVRLGQRVIEILRERRAITRTMDEMRSPAFDEAFADIRAQLAGLLPVDFLDSTPARWLDQFPRYLKAITKRIDRLRDNVARDAELARKVAPFVSALAGIERLPSTPAARAEVETLRWMIEELRVSLFAQELRTLLRVSVPRLEQQLDKVRGYVRVRSRVS